MTIYGHAYGCDGWTSTPAGTAIDQQERSLVKMDTVLGGAMPMHAIALGSSLVSSEIDWTDPKRVRRSRAVPFSAVLQVMGDPSISTVTFKPASGD